MTETINGCMHHVTTEQKIYFTLRLAVAMCFIGHGAFGIITKPIWCNYFAVFGIGKDLAYTLMPTLGAVDILIGVAILFYPVRVFVMWLVVWGMVTALLRPMSGESFGEFFERAGNYGAPFALLVLTGVHISGLNQLFQPLTATIPPNPSRLKKVQWVLQIVVFLLIAGHGWLNLILKKSILDQYSLLGFSNPAKVARAIGSVEVALAFSVLIKPVASLLLFLFAWKMLSEAFYPNYPLFEWIERGGSYGCILALWFTLRSGSPIFNIIPRRKIHAPG